MLNSTTAWSYTHTLSPHSFLEAVPDQSLEAAGLGVRKSHRDFGEQKLCWAASSAYSRVSNAFSSFIRCTGSPGSLSEASAIESGDLLRVIVGWAHSASKRLPGAQHVKVHYS